MIKMVKVNSTIEVNFDANAFSRASSKIWFPTDRDRIFTIQAIRDNPTRHLHLSDIGNFQIGNQSTYLDLGNTGFLRLRKDDANSPVVLTYCTVRRQGIINLGDIRDQHGLITNNNARYIDLYPMGLPLAAQQHIWNYKGYPCRLKTNDFTYFETRAIDAYYDRQISNRWVRQIPDNITEGDNQDVIGDDGVLIDAWIGDETSASFESFYLYDYNGNKIMGDNSLIGKPNTLVDWESYIITNSNMLDADGVRQASALDNNNRAVTSGAIETRYGLNTADINRDSSFKMTVVLSEVLPSTFDFTDTSVIERETHRIIGIVNDRHNAGLSDTPLGFGENGIFEIPSGSGNYYNMVQFTEGADNSVTVGFELNQ